MVYSVSKESQLGSKQERKTNKSKWDKFRRNFLQGKENWEGYYECKDCKRWFERAAIDLHHIVHRSQRKDLIYVEANIAMICRECHNKRHGIIVKST